jgi:ribosome-associated heat shock protein Hsp15
MSEAALRLDKFLFFARLAKTRALAAALCAEGRVRLNGTVTEKAHANVRPGDVITVPQGARVLVVRVVALPVRRGPAPEAQACYEAAG